MKRKIYTQLVDWKSQEHHKPLILNGVRQCGKTYILKEFGLNEYVLQQLLASGINHIYYYSSETSRMEMDFLVQRNGAILPIEVKGGTSIKATSLHNYLMEHPDISAIRYSMLPYRQQENITNMPLYGVFL